MRRLIRIFMVLVAVGASLVMYTGLPEQVPVHWNIRGEVDGYGSRFAVLFLSPLMMIGVWTLLRFLPRIDPLRANYARFAGTYEVIIDSVMAMMLVIHLAILLGASGAPDSVSLVVRAAIGAMFIVMGNVMPRTRQNWFVGVRTPWTLASERVWERTHRLAGYLFVALGLVIILTTPLAPQIGMPILAAGVATVALVSVIYSYLEWRKEKA
ncbi:MAG TPA: SdpI family protein [Gemmatimonadaceae bacterium]|nr:SdpI family protein [Gemmatimonadaceae bacterium]